MRAVEVRNRAGELEELLRQVHRIDEAFYLELLDDWFVLVHALKYVRDTYPWERGIEIEEERSSIEARLPSVTEKEFTDYVTLWDLLGVLYEEVK